MSRMESVSDSVVIAAPADEVYRRVSDPTQMGRWSGEAVGATVLGDRRDGAYVGMEFDGHNRNNRKLRGWWNFAFPKWTTRCVVTAAEAPRHFAFLVTGQMLGAKRKPRLAFNVATWDYRFTEVDGGTEVTETWIDERSSSRFGRVSRRGDRVFTGGPTFPEFQARNIASTLARLKDDIEAGT